MFTDLIDNKESEIRDLAITEYMSSRGVRYSAIDSLLYAIKVKTNAMVYDIESKQKDNDGD